MGFVFCNPNPERISITDCVVRAVAIAQNRSWDDVYMDLCMLGLKMHDMPNNNAVWDAYLRAEGWRRFGIPDTCPSCYTVRDFCIDNPYGIFVLGTGEHAMAVIDGNYYDTSDSGDEVPRYYYVFEGGKNV